MKTDLEFAGFSAFEDVPSPEGEGAMILQNGFGQAIAFWIAKGKGEHVAL